MNNNILQSVKKFPQKPGVYIFRGSKRAILYIGKATSLRSRVQSYFGKNLMETRGPILVGMIESAKSVDYLETDSVLEALILEAHLIKKHHPPYNTKEKDNKSFNCIAITDEAFPRVMIVRGRELLFDQTGMKYVFGPFPSGTVLKEALGIVRKIFPFRDTCKTDQGKLCFNAQIGLCPGVCAGKISIKEYGRTIQRIKLFFEGRKKELLRSIEKDMKIAAKELKFEEASRLKKTIFAHNHIQDVALMKENFNAEARELGATIRIEAYDVAHISGTNVVGVMVVVENGEAKKSDYRKFKIRTSKNDDNASLREILSRRFNHSEWPMPQVIAVDGGKAQVNTAEGALKEWGIEIPVVGVVKDEHHRPREIIGNKKARSLYERAILLANSEAHRFAITYHRSLREKI